MKDRIKKLRQSLGLTQQEFGDRIGIRKSSLSMLESGKNNPSEQTILAICREFNVRADWLRIGEGEPFKKDDVIDRVENNALPVATVALVRAFESLPEEMRLSVIQFARSFVSGLEIEETKAEAASAISQPPEASQSAPAGEGVKKPPETDTSGLTASQEAELAEIARQMRLETEAAEKSYHSSAG